MGWGTGPGGRNQAFIHAKNETSFAASIGHISSEVNAKTPDRLFDKTGRALSSQSYSICAHQAHVDRVTLNVHAVVPDTQACAIISPVNANLSRVVPWR